MALRLRRGTDAERQLITPVEGELIYTTDTKSVYIGDGTTAGGIVISGEIGLSDLAEVDLSTPPTVGQALVWDGTKFVPDDISGTAPETLSVFDLADVFKVTDPDVGDTLAWDGLNFTPAKILSSIFELNDVAKVTDPDPGNVLIWDGANFVPDRIRIIEGDDSSIMVNTATNTFTGNFVGDGSGLTNLPGFSPETISIFTLNDVFKVTDPNPGDLLIYDGFNFTPRKIDQIEGTDSTIILDAETNTFTGRFVGDGSGLTNLSVDEILDGSNYRINIVGEDSSIIIDTSINEVSANTGRFNQFISNPDINPEIEFITEGIDQTDVFINAIDNFGRLHFYRKSDTDISGSNFRYGQILFGSEDINGRTNSAIISSNRDFIWMGHRTGGSIQNEDIMFMTNGDTGFGTITPQAKVDINGSLIARGNATITGTITAASFNGSLVTDDSTTIIDAIDGSITAQSFVQFGSLTATERDTLNASNGMVIYNTTANRFQGYQNGAWINLDDGSAA
jgi:hypothetical protein